MIVIILTIVLVVCLMNKIKTRKRFLTVWTALYNKAICSTDITSEQKVELVRTFMDVYKRINKCFWTMGPKKYETYVDAIIKFIISELLNNND